MPQEAQLLHFVIVCDCVCVFKKNLNLNLNFASSSFCGARHDGYLSRRGQRGRGLGGYGAPARHGKQQDEQYALYEREAEEVGGRREAQRRTDRLHHRPGREGGEAGAQALNDRAADPG